MVWPAYSEEPFHPHSYDEVDAGAECDSVDRVVEVRPDVGVGQEDAVGGGEIISHNFKHCKKDMEAANQKNVSSMQLYILWTTCLLY